MRTSIYKEKIDRAKKIFVIFRQAGLLVDEKRGDGGCRVKAIGIGHRVHQGMNRWKNRVLVVIENIILFRDDIVGHVVHLLDGHTQNQHLIKR